MGWRDRVKNNSAYSAYIALDGEIPEWLKKERKKGFQTTFTDITQNSPKGRQIYEPSLCQNTQINAKYANPEDPRKYGDSGINKCQKINCAEFCVKKENTKNTDPNARADRTNPDKSREHWETMIRCPAGTISMQVEKKQSGIESCPACGQCQWWRLNSEESKLICGRCHPPAHGLDVLKEVEERRAKSRQVENLKQNQTDAVPENNPEREKGDARDIAAKKTKSGMTLEAIAEADGTVDSSTVKRNLDSVIANAKTETPSKIKGKDGKTYPSKKPRKKTVYISQETVEKAEKLPEQHKPKGQERIIQALQHGECKYLIATGQLIGEGFDLPGISSVFLGTPVTFSGRLIQYIGRALKPAPGKDKAVIFDFVDDRGVFRASARSRAYTYQAQGIRA